MEQILVHYHVALMSLAILCTIVLIQSVLCAVFAFTKKGGQNPGRVVGGPEDFSWRVLRTYINSTENLAAFGIVVLLAVAAGVSAKWVNILAVTHLVFRILFWCVYYSKAGIKSPGLRTLMYVGGWLANLILAIMTIVALAH